MTLQKDFEVLTDNSDQAGSLYAALFARGKSRQHAYESIVELARQAGLGIVRMTVLLVKYEDERRDKVEAMDQDDKHPADEAWATREFFNTVSAYGDQYQIITRHDLAMLVAELKLLGLKDLPTDSPALAYIEEQRRVTVEQLSDIDGKTAQQYRRLKTHWLCHNVELKSSETTHDDLMRQTASIHREFMNIFGREFLAEMEQFNRMNVATRRLQLVKENPGFDEADIERMLGKGKARADTRLSMHQLGLPAGYRLSLPGDPMPSDAGVKAKSIWRSLATLTHPDKIRQLGLGWAQRMQLESIWDEVSSLRTQSKNKTVLARSVPYLETKLRLAERILELAHIEELDATLIAQGTSIDEQIQWLESANEFLDEQIQLSQADNLQYTCNRQLVDMQALVEASDETQATERQAMVEKCETFRKRAEALENEASRFICACA